MKILELQEMIDFIAEEYGDIEVCMDIKDDDAVFDITQVLIENFQDSARKRAVLCYGNYIYDSPLLTLVK